MQQIEQSSAGTGRGRKQRLRRGATLLSAAAVVIMQCGCTGLFFYPSKTMLLTPQDLGLSYEDVWLRTGDGVKIHAWLLTTAEAPRARVLFLHGNAENASTHIKSVYWLPAEGYEVLVVDYRGYGQSKGRATLAGLHLDALAGFNFLAERAGGRPGSVVIFGQSLGGAVALEAARSVKDRPELLTVIADSAFSSYREVFRDKLKQFMLTYLLSYPLSVAVSGRFEPLTAAKELSPVPLLLVHGSADTIVLPYHSRRLFEAAREPKEFWMIEGAGHIQSAALPQYRRRLLDYLHNCIENAPARRQAAADN